MSIKTVNLYGELEEFIKQETDTWEKEATLIGKLNEYARELRKEGEEQAKESNLNAVIAAADKARARGFDEGERKGIHERVQAYNDGVADGKQQAQDVINREKSAKESALKKADEYYKIAVRSNDKLAETKAKGYDKGRQEGWKDGFECGDKYRRAESMGELSNSLRELIKDSIKKHGGDDEKIVGDIEARFTWMMNNAQHVTDGQPTRYRAKWLIALAVMRAIGRDIKEKDNTTTNRQNAYAIELANELLKAGGM